MRFLNFLVLCYCCMSCSERTESVLLQNKLALGSTLSSCWSAIDSAAFYVSPTGNDADSGTITAPFLTLERARSAMRASAIKTTYLREGTYTRSATFILDSSDNGQTWKTYPGDPVNSAVIDGNGIQDVIDILGGSHILIEGLLVRNFTSRGIGIHGGRGWSNAAPYFNATYGPATHNTIRNNIVEDGNVPAPGWDRAGINTQGTVPNTRILNNVIRNTTGYGIGVWSLQTGDDISGTEVRNNALLNTCITARDGAAIYTNDRTILSDSIFIENNFIRDYGQFDNFVRAVYLDDHTSNTTVRGNIMAGTGRQPILVHGGFNNNITGNILDLGSTGKMAVLNYAIRGTATMTGNRFEKNIIISQYAIDSAGGAYLKTGDVVPPVIQHNLYYNYSTGIANTGGYHYEMKDSFPVQGDPGLSGWTYILSPTGFATQAPVNFQDPDRNWGPPGYSIPNTGTSPSCLLPGSDDIYLHAESFDQMFGIQHKGMYIGSCDHNDWVKFNQVDLKTGYSQFTVRLGVTATGAGKKVQVRLGSPTGTLIGELTTVSTGGYDKLQEQTSTLTGGTGLQDVYFVFNGGSGVGNVDYFKIH